MTDKVLIGYKEGLNVYCSQTLIAQHGIYECREILNLGVREWPVKTDLSGNTVMVKGATHEDAINRYLNRSEK